MILARMSGQPLCILSLGAVNALWRDGSSATNRISKAAPAWAVSAPPLFLGTAFIVHTDIPSQGLKRMIWPADAGATGLERRRHDRRRRGGRARGGPDSRDASRRPAGCGSRKDPQERGTGKARRVDKGHCESSNRLAVISDPTDGHRVASGSDHRVVAVDGAGNGAAMRLKSAAEKAERGYR